MIDNLKRLPPEKVERFLQMRNPDNSDIPKQLAEYILQIDEAAKLNKKYQSISECARQLQKIYPNLSISTCKTRIYDAINYFNSDCSVTEESWNLFFADQMMQLRDINIAAHDFREARICTERAREYRIAASSKAINPDLIKFKDLIVSPDVNLERMGIKSKGLVAHYKKAMSIIESRDIPAVDKERLRKEVDMELNIEDAEYERT